MLTVSVSTWVLGVLIALSISFIVGFYFEEIRGRRLRRITDRMEHRRWSLPGGHHLWWVEFDQNNEGNIAVEQMNDWDELVGQIG